MSPTQEKRIAEILTNYKQKIIPLILSLEVSDSEYPVEIMNEIRGMVNHLATITLSPSGPDVDALIDKMYSHYKRALYDCYKYLCISKMDAYDHFCKQYKYLDLSLVDNGDFLKELCALHNEAVELTVKARETEYTPTVDMDEVVNGYELAYRHCSALVRYINDNQTKIETLKHKHTSATKLGIAGLVVGIVGTIAGIVGAILATIAIL